MNRIPVRQGSLVDKLQSWLAENPGQELNLPLICRTFDVKYRAAVSAVERLKEAGIVEVKHVVRLRAKEEEVA
ncbi:hypothetical protein [Brevundimonas sp.]|jgi:hypothetical protein|uniref:hypothetical protein n=1 Tax=Brevundimonas sp. TaxID=1871086 RepID=UPI0037839B73